MHSSRTPSYKFLNYINSNEVISKLYIKSSPLRNYVNTI